jgi:hypothetical protein
MALLVNRALPLAVASSTGMARGLTYEPGTAVAEGDRRARPL